MWAEVSFNLSQITCLTDRWTAYAKTALHSCSVVKKVTWRLKVTHLLMILLMPKFRYLLV